VKRSLFLLCLLIVAANLSAQQNPDRVTLRGEVLFEGVRSANDFVVELRNISGAAIPVRLPLMLDGTFEFRNAEIADYEVKVTSRSGEIVLEDFIKARETGGWVLLRAHPRNSIPPAGGGVISVQRLLHPIPNKAEAEFVRSAEASRVGDVKRSIRHLENALRIYPKYMEAHNNLGVAYMNQAQFVKAAAQFRDVVTLDPLSDKGHLNLALALLALRQYEEAESSVRRALEVSPRSIPAHYALGQVLYGEKKNTSEALESLQKAAEDFPNARLLLADMLLVRGAFPEAVQELRKYLESGLPQKREEVQSWLDQLTRTIKP